MAVSDFFFLFVFVFLAYPVNLTNEALNEHLILQIQNEHLTVQLNYLQRWRQWPDKDRRY